MNAAVPFVTSLFYLVTGYLLVVGMVGSAVAVIARKAANRNAYIGLAVLGFAAAGFQYCTALYYQSDSMAGATQLLVWQVDFAALALLAVCVMVTQGDVRGAAGGPWWSSGYGLIALLMIAINHIGPHSAHFARLHGLQHSAVWGWTGLGYLQGEPGIWSVFWLLLAGVLLWVPARVALRCWRQRRGVDALVISQYVGLQAAALLWWLLIDLGWQQGLYVNGFVFALFSAATTYRMTAEATRRSQQLVAHEREMEGEIVQRRAAEEKLRRLSQVFMQASVPSHIVDRSGTARQVNEASLRYLRRDVSAEPRVNFLAVLERLGEDRAGLMRDFRQGEQRVFGPYRFTAGQAVEHLQLSKNAWLSFSVSPIFNDADELEELVVQLEDVTEQQFVANAINAISTTVSTEAGRAFFNKLVVQLARLLGCKHIFIGLRTALQGQAALETLAVAEDGELTGNVCFPLEGTLTARVLKSGALAIARDLQMQSLRTGFYEAGMSSFFGAAIEDEQKRRIGALVVLDAKPMPHIEQIQQLLNIFVSRISTELQRLENEKTIHRMAFEDQLTGLPNRSSIQEYVTQLLSAGELATSAFIQIDLDHFKTINDALGHDIGDEVLRCLGDRLMRHAEENMAVGRIGGDEFAVVVQGLAEAVREDLDRITSQLAQLMEKPVQVGDHLLDVGCTMGVVVFPESARTAIDVFRSADTALYRAKNAGRGGYTLFTPAMREVVHNRLNVEKGLRAALHNGDLRLYFQPQINAAGMLVGAEALIRWHHPEQGVIPPSHFISVAEETGLINPLGHWVLCEALRQRHDWYVRDIPFAGRLSINVSAWQFARPDFVEGVAQAVADAQVAPQLVALEVTESAVLADVDETIGKLRELRHFGISIALDDFGTGYSSLAYLRDLPLDRIKIDKAFVDALETESHEPLLESMIAIGRHMNLEVVAEGVETRVQLTRLKNLGCLIFQGDYFAKPMSDVDFIQWLAHRNRRAGSK